jgi:hypothetical protein
VLRLLAWLGAVALAAGLTCGALGAAPRFRPTHVFDFRDGAQGFTGGFADDPAGEEANYELGFGEAPLPSGLAHGVTRRQGFTTESRSTRRMHGEDPGIVCAVPLRGSPTPWPFSVSSVTPW